MVDPMSELSRPTVRISQNQIRSNPILHSRRAFCSGFGRRDQERRQLECLIRLQQEGIPVFRTPNWIRVDASRLQTSQDRIGSVGLVVDAGGENAVGYTTRLTAEPNRTWDISADLPFRPVHLQSLLLRVLGEIGIDDGLPELFAFRVTDTLTQRCEGDSMDLAGLLSIIDAVTGRREKLLAATAAVVSPVGQDELEPSKSVATKLTAFEREFGRGSLLIRHPDDIDAAEFDHLFVFVWKIARVAELAAYLRQSELTVPLLAAFPLRTEHAGAIAARIEYLHQNESEFVEASHFIRRLHDRMDENTPLRIKLDVSFAEEDILRHRGNFGSAIEVRRQRHWLETNPNLTSYERRADSDNRHAAALYDAHRFEEAIETLLPWAEKFCDDPQVCSPETRAVLFNTLSRCMVTQFDQRWESFLHQSISIQQAIDPANVGRTKNYLIHGYLKFGRSDDALTILSQSSSEKTDPYLIWLTAEHARLTEQTWSEAEIDRITFDARNHVCGFIFQAIARQPSQSPEIRSKLLRRAAGTFSYRVDYDATNLKRLLVSYCDLASFVSVKDEPSVSRAIRSCMDVLAIPGFEYVNNWYRDELNCVKQDRDWNAIERLFMRVPHL